MSGERRSPRSGAPVSFTRTDSSLPSAPLTSTSEPTQSGAPDPGASAALYHVAALILESRRALVLLGLAGALAAALITTLLGTRFSAVASFMPQSGGDTDLSALMGIAGQFGVPLRTGSSAPSPELYAALVTSPMVLEPISRELFSRDTMGAAPESLAVLLRIRTRAPRRRQEKVVEKLQDVVTTSVDRRTGVIGLRVRTRYAAVSDRIAERILEELNAFNLHRRQSQARAEREFAERRAVEARAQLTTAENAARDFAMRNRVVSESPSLRLEVDRLEREVNLRQQLLMTTEQSLESARIREVQDTPVLTVLQEPLTRSVPDPRGRIKWTILGGILGLLVAAILIPARAVLASSREAQTPEAARFRAALEATRRHLLGPFAPYAGD